MAKDKDYTKATHLAVAPGYYGRGFSIAEAKASLKAQGASLAQYVIFKMPPGAENPRVNGFGTVEWTWAKGADTGGSAEVVAKHGVKNVNKS